MDYPYSPPTFRFLTKMWHPNIYENGDVCISILHPPVDDPQSGELPSERWNPTQNVRTILLSVISLLNEPNTFSPANVDASVMFRKWRDSKGKDKEYAEIIRKQVLATKAEAEKDGVKVPTTLAEYCIQTKVPSHDSSSDLLYDDLYDDDIEEEEEDEDGECGGGAEEGDCYEDDDDSGNEEKQVLATKAEAEKDGVKVPTTLAEYCIQTKVPSHDSSSDLLYDDLYDDDIEEEEEDEDGECGGGAEEGDCYEDDDDSGNEES
ncbi:UNVERIFIED_CONTAM: hypothetical protein FKN15_005972 [Acipenser sinensis]